MRNPNLQAKKVTPFEVEFVNIIKSTRRSKKISQAKMAELLDISTAQYQKYDNSESRLNFGRAIEICKILDIDVNQAITKAYRNIKSD